MKKKFQDVLDSVDYIELLRMKKDIEEGGQNLRKFIEEELDERDRQHETICSVCTADINLANPNNFTLIFGPDDFKKKATFCGKDCLTYFLGKFESMKQGKLPKTIQ